jgi:DNA repair exonuclease SbcCD nuclease subunit
VNKTLLVGDPHIKINSLQEGELFLLQLLGLIREEEPKQVILLGDQFDSFAVIRSEVLALWSDFLLNAGHYTKVVLLVGNHDMAGETGGTHAMEAFKSYPNVTVVDNLTEINGIYYMSFVRSVDEFSAIAKAVPEGSVLFCHQSFNGVQFVNGFFDPHGVPTESIQHLSAVISGHIHTEQKIDKIWYPGTPYQHTFADAGEDKGVYAIDLATDGYTVMKKHKFKMPIFVNVEGSIESLISFAENATENDLSSVNIKFIATATPAEIADFWKNSSVMSLKKSAKRVVDALTTVKPDKVLAGASAKTQKEKVHEFVHSRKWRTEPKRLVSAIEQLLAE